MITTAGVYSSVVTEADSITEPVLVEDIKTFARIEHSDDDALLALMNTAARQDIENYCGVKLVDSSVTAFINIKDDEDEIFQFPSAIRSMIDDDSLVVNLLSKGQDDELQVIDDNYYFSQGLSFALTGKYRIEYDVDVASVPETVKEAIKMLVAYRYNNRGDQEPGLQQGIPEDVKAKVNAYRQIWL